jgi:hypothetical protein
MSAKIKIVIAVVLVAVLIVLAIGLLSGGDDEADKSGTPTAKDGGSGDGDGGGDEQPGTGSGSPLRTIATERRSGPKASVANGALVDAPREIYLRVSAAPKQAVKGNWSVTCGKLGTSMDSYEVTPPSLIRLELPGKNPKSCAVGTSAQLTGSGRVKTAILTNR